MESLPLELCIHHIFNHVDTTSTVRSMRVSKYWKELIEQVLPHLEIDVSYNEFISDNNLVIFSENKSINLSHCLSLTGSTVWLIQPDKLNLEGCINLSDCVLKYLIGIKELNIRGIYDLKDYRINNDFFSELRTLTVKAGRGTKYILVIGAPKLTNLTIHDFRITPELFKQYQQLTTIHFINCSFNSDFCYNKSNINYYKKIESITFDYCSDQVNLDDYDDRIDYIIAFVTKYLPNTCTITFHHNIDEKEININNVSKEEFLKLIKQ